MGDREEKEEGPGELFELVPPPDPNLPGKTPASNQFTSEDLIRIWTRHLTTDEKIEFASSVAASTRVVQAIIGRRYKPYSARDMLRIWAKHLSPIEKEKFRVIFCETCRELPPKETALQEEILRLKDVIKELQSKLDQSITIGIDVVKREQEYIDRIDFLKEIPLSFIEIVINDVLFVIDTFTSIRLFIKNIQKVFNFVDFANAQFFGTRISREVPAEWVDILQEAIDSVAILGKNHENLELFVDKSREIAQNVEILRKEVKK